jgi:hypothetical protein
MSYDAVAKAIPTMSYEEQVSLMELLIESIKQALPKRSDKTEKKTAAQIKEQFLQIKPSEICIPSIVVAELEFGARHSPLYCATPLNSSIDLKPFAFM